MNNETQKHKGVGWLETVGYILLYTLSFPFILAFCIIAGVVGSVLLFLYVLYELIAWPITELIEYRKNKKRAKEAKNAVPEIIELDDGFLEESKSE